MTRTSAAGLVVAVMAVVGLGVAAEAGAEIAPCDVVRSGEVGRLLGSVADRTTVSVEGSEGCRYAVGATLTLDLVVLDGGSDDYGRLLRDHDAADRRTIADYVDEASFAWGVDEATELMARRGDTVVLTRAFGTAPGFDAADPTADAPGGDPAGTRVGSAMWALTTSALAATSDADVPTTDDLTGWWRTDDITPCSPARDVTTRITRIAQDGEQVAATKVTGDSCLEDGEADFSGTARGAAGEGLAFGLGTGSSTAGIPYELTAVSPEQLRLTGTSGSLRYTVVYERLSWPGLDGASSVLLGIPSPSQALTAKNVGLAAALSVVLFGLVLFPTTLFNSTLEANLDRYAALVDRLRRRLRPGAAARTAGATNAGSASRWERPAGVAIYLVGSGVLYSFMQPGWGPNMATLITFLGFVISLVATSAVTVVATRVYYGFRYRNGGGHPDIAGSTLAIAAVSVAASRAVGFVPGYLYGVVVGWDPDHDGDEFDRGRVVAFASTLTAIVALVSWALIPVCRRLGDDPDSFSSIPLGLVAGLFVGSAQSLAIGLIPLDFLPGRTLRDHRPRTWIALWATGGFLFALVLLRPGLTTADSNSIWGTLVLAVVAAAASVGFWAAHRPRALTR